MDEAKKRDRVSRIQFEMSREELNYTHYETFTVHTVTWNVNGQMTTPLDSLLTCTMDPPDIYAIGFQELDLSKEAFLFDQTPREDTWLIAATNGLDKRDKYSLVDKVRLVGMLLIVFVKEKHLKDVKDVMVCTVGTGLLGRMGNKGGVSIRFTLHNTSICFVNAHLAAHIEEFERRNQDYNEICQRTRFQFSDGAPLFIRDHDQIYWIGDLNYRITSLSYGYVMFELANGNLSELIAHDQLKHQIKAHNVFSGFEEGEINFKPTYKYDPGTDNWDSSEKNRLPAWCDRILWKGNGIKQLTYRSHPSLNISDHKPVLATFESKIQIINPERQRTCFLNVIKRLDQMENELIPQVSVDKTELCFGVVRYLQAEERSLTLTNTGQVAARYEFIKKFADESYAKEWLTADPLTKYVLPGEQCEIKIVVNITKETVCKLNIEEDKIYNILVLHIDGGKDIFITVMGTYEHTCFGISIETLSLTIFPIAFYDMNELKIHEQNVNIANERIQKCMIPKEYWFLIDYLCQKGLNHPNLFEQPGLPGELIKIRDWLDNGCRDNLNVSPHAAAEALLLLFESLREPLIPYRLHGVCLQASSNYIQSKQLIKKLSLPRLRLFLYMCMFLSELLKYSASNGLDVTSLTTLFGTVFIRDKDNKSRSREAQHDIDCKKAAFITHFLNGSQDLIDNYLIINSRNI